MCRSAQRKPRQGEGNQQQVTQPPGSSLPPRLYAMAALALPRAASEDPIRRRSDSGCSGGRCPAGCAGKHSAMIAPSRCDHDGRQKSTSTVKSTPNEPI